MDSVFCIDVGVFADALTRGKQYIVLERHNRKREIKIQGDNDRVRWYPTYCFAKTDKNLFRLKDIHIDDKIENPYEGAIEVTVTVLQGEKETRRWCYFLTPSFIYKLFGSPTDIPFTSGRHGIFVPALTEEGINEALHYLESQNMLEEHTLPLGG